MKFLGMMHYFLGMEVWQSEYGSFLGLGKYVLPPFTHLGYVAEIFKPLGVSLGASLEPRLSPCS